MNLSPFYIAVEALGWCFVALVLAKVKAKPRCPAAATGGPRGAGVIMVALALATLATIFFAVAGRGLAAMLAFAGYSLAWLRFEAYYDAKQALRDGRGRRVRRRRT